MNNVIFPFGPPIYINEMKKEILDELDIRIEEAMRDNGAEVDAPLMTQIVEHFERLANE